MPLRGLPAEEDGYPSAIARAAPGRHSGRWHRTNGVESVLSELRREIGTLTLASHPAPLTLAQAARAWRENNHRRASAAGATYQIVEEVPTTVVGKHSPEK